MNVLEVKNLTKSFGTFQALKGISFNVESNRVVGFLGPNGAGKTTTLRILVGLSEKTSGDIKIFGEDLVFGNEKTRSSVGYLPEQPSLYPWMTGYEYLSFISDIFKIPSSKKEKKIEELLKRVNLYDFRNRKIGTYSNGMKQRVGIAQAIINDPKLVIFDEPVSALDPIGRKEVLQIIENLKETSTVLFSTHILSDVDRICDDVILINKGNLVVSSSLPKLKSQYSSAILDVEFKKISKAEIKDISEEKWVKETELNGNHVRIWLTNADVLDENIPMKYFLKKNLGVIKYGLVAPETEDLFLELLGGKKDE